MSEHADPFEPAGRYRRDSDLGDCIKLDDIVMELDSAEKGLQRMVGKHQNVYELSEKKWYVDGHVDADQFEDNSELNKFMNEAQENERERRLSLLMDQNLGSIIEKRKQSNVHQELRGLFQEKNDKEINDTGCSAVGKCSQVKSDVIRKTARQLISAECEKERERRVSLLSEMAEGKSDLVMPLADINDNLRLVQRDLLCCFRKTKQNSIINERRQRKNSEDYKELLMMEIRRRSSLKISAISMEHERQKRIKEYEKRCQSSHFLEADKNLAAVQTEMLDLFGKFKKREASNALAGSENVADFKTRVQEDLVRKANAKEADLKMAAERKRRLTEPDCSLTEEMTKERQKIHEELLHSVSEK